MASKGLCSSLTHMHCVFTRFIKCNRTNNWRELIKEVILTLIRFTLAKSFPPSLWRYNSAILLRRFCLICFFCDYFSNKITNVLHMSAKIIDIYTSSAINTVVLQEIVHAFLLRQPFHCVTGW